MTLYVWRGFWGRYIGLLIFLALVFVYGCFELWRAQTGGGDSSGVMFGVVFLGGSLFALRGVLQENRDLVVALARPPDSSDLVVTVFARFNVTEVTAPPGAFSNWRLHRKTIGRNRFAFFIHVDCSAWPRPLRFDLKPGTDLAGLRGLAPEAVAEFEGPIAPAKTQNAS
jgi:hypothetical protein